MPIKVRYDRKLRKWIVVNTQTNHVFGKHPNQDAAQRQWDAMKRNGVDMEGTVAKEGNA